MPKMTKLGVARQCTMLQSKNYPPEVIRIWERYAQRQGWPLVERHCSTMATLAEQHQARLS